jgi:hypothetical protein
MTAHSNTSINNNNNNDNVKAKIPKDQIPTEYNEEQTLRVIRKQDRISGEARGKTIYDFPYTAAVARVLKDLDFPANKQKIIRYTELKRLTMPETN